MTAKTRLGEGGYGERRYGSFAGKTPAPTQHIISRFGEGGYGVRRYRAGAFAGKTPSPSGSGRPFDHPLIVTMGKLMSR